MVFANCCKQNGRKADECAKILLEIAVMVVTPMTVE